MNLPAVVNGGGSGFPAVSVGNKYQRMDSDAERSGEDDGETRNSRTRKYVMACAFFASLNNVLLGYGEFSSYNDFNRILSSFYLDVFFCIVLQMLG